ncbi:MAG TPA: mechanosensitive ion channel domain-containing protein [Lachnospiraceae bacterium]|nr:mechanosensitive ion channel domain-containing protein [Lachnospiraceae bacterium]
MPNLLESTGTVDTGVIERFLKELPEQALKLGIRVVFSFLFLFIGAQVIKVLRKIVRKSLLRGNADKGVIQFLDSFLKTILYVILIFMIAASFGLDATSVVAIVGSAGVALGLALQGSLSNLAGGVLILLLKPFRVGDYIKEDSNGNEGTVDEIQLFYTKLKTPDNKVVVLPNGTLANTSLTNSTATPYRRFDFFIGISYQADLLKVKTVIEELLRLEENVIKDKPIQVFVDRIESSSVIIGARCFIINEIYFDTKWKLTEAIKLSMDSNGIEMPFPQLDVHLK